MAAASDRSAEQRLDARRPRAAAGRPAPSPSATAPSTPPGSGSRTTPASAAGARLQQRRAGPRRWAGSGRCGDGATAMIPHMEAPGYSAAPCGARLAVRCGRPPARSPSVRPSRRLHGCDQPVGDLVRPAAAVGASTITRTSGSVPLGRTQHPAVVAELGRRPRRSRRRAESATSACGWATATLTSTWGRRVIDAAASSASGRPDAPHDVEQPEAGQQAVAGAWPASRKMTWPDCSPPRS